MHFPWFGHEIVIKMHTRAAKWGNQSIMPPPPQSLTISYHNIGRQCVPTSRAKGAPGRVMTDESFHRRLTVPAGAPSVTSIYDISPKSGGVFG